MVNTTGRLNDLRRALGFSWKQLAERLGVSYVTLYYVKSGRKPLSVKLDHRIRQAEETAGLVSAPIASASRAASPDEPDIEWLESLKRRWKRKTPAHDEMALAIRVLFPDHAKQILAWLKK